MYVASLEQLLNEAGQFLSNVRFEKFIHLCLEELNQNILKKGA